MYEGLHRNGQSTFSLVLTGIMTALTTIATVLIVVPFPTSTGYLNFGDALVLVSGMILGPIGGFVAGGVGSATGDLLLGYTHFAPITLIVKGLEGLAIGFFARYSPKPSRLGVRDVIGLVLASAIMLSGYFLAEIPLVGFGPAIAELLTVNLFQVTAGSIVAALAGPRLRAYISSVIHYRSDSLGSFAEEQTQTSVSE